MAYRVELELPDGSTRTVEAEDGEYVLHAAHRAGVDLPCICQQGWDLACAVRVLEGRLDHRDARRYYREDDQAGFALICRAKACSDLRLRTHQTEAMRANRAAHALPAPLGT